MLPELRQGFERVEQQRTDLQNVTLGLTDTQWDAPPSLDTWSIRQIVEHLVLSEETMGRALEAGAVPTEEWMFRVLPRALRRVLVIGALSRDKVLPLPSSSVEPGGTVSLPVLWERWAAARMELACALNGMGRDECLFFHPVLGPLTAEQMLALGQAHTAYHTRQIEAMRRGL